LPIQSPADPFPTRFAKDFLYQFRDLFVHLKVHKALRYLNETHPRHPSIPFTVGDEMEDLKKWDWSRVKVRLVLSIPGTYEGTGNMKQFGICRLGSVLEEEKWVPGKAEIVKAEFQVGYPVRLVVYAMLIV
jgi:tyrosyl-DNA phosphodiesterase-1